MNTISGRILSLIAILFLLPAWATAEEESKIDSTFSLTVELSGGYTSHINKYDDLSDLSVRGITPSLRILWEPNHRLNLGLETARIHIVNESGTKKTEEYGNTDYEASLNAIPILLVFNMEVWKIEFNVGMGTSYVWSTLESFGSEVRSHEWNYCMMVSLEYSLEITDRFAMGLEFKTYFMTKIEKAAGGIMLKAQYSFWKW